MSWNASSAGDVAGYRVYRALGSGALLVVSGSSLLTTTQFTDIGLSEGATYRFAVGVVDSSGNESIKGKIVSMQQPTFSAPSVRAADCPAGGVAVANITQLRTALVNAGPGSVIKLAPGTYRGGITVTTSGTSANPIWICGPRTAIFDNFNVASANGVFINTASYVNLAGFSIQNFRKGVVLSSASHISVADLAINNVGNEAIKLRYGTVDSIVIGNVISKTGLVDSVYGEGVYIGTSPKDWCDVYACKADMSDRNWVIDNTISGTTADPIEAKPGTSGGVIRGNHVDGTALIDVSTIMAIKGKQYFVADNVGTNGKADVGFFSAETEVAGYGRNNSFARNTVSVPKGSTGIYVGTNAGNVVDCTNSVLVSGSVLTNVTCQK
ncbi:hypothetical protein B7R23_02625 [Subtercola boreus]|nr:hypothetical protein B7R24_02630 [Subtercola boreus]RFA22895.1 hypothetical protein B7R23_02625 [Subtercola boreus]